MIEPRIVNVFFVDRRTGRTEVWAQFADGAQATRELFSYYPDELYFRADELMGLTETEARALHHQRDMEYLRS